MANITVHELYLHLDLYILYLMHSLHDGTGLIYPRFDAINEVSGFESRTSHYFCAQIQEIVYKFSFR